MTVTKRKQVGDIIEIRTPLGFAYAQYLGRLEGRFGALGDAFALFEFVGPSLADDLHRLSETQVRNTFLSVLNVLLMDQRFQRVGKLPTVIDLESIAFRQQTFSGWIIVNARMERYIRVPLSDEDAAKPIVEILPSQSVIDRIVSGWKPEDDKDEFLTELRRQVRKGLNSAREMHVFVELPRQMARECGEAFRRNGFTVIVEGKSSGSATDVPTIVASKTLVDTSSTEIGRVEKLVEQIASGYQGTVVGHEIEL